MSVWKGLGASAMPPVLNEPWREEAACAGRNPAMWDPVDGQVTTAHVQRWARGAAICQGCPVAVACAAAVTRADAGTIRAGRLVAGDGRLGPLRRSEVGRPPRQPAVDDG